MKLKFNSSNQKKQDKQLLDYQKVSMKKFC